MVIRSCRVRATNSERLLNTGSRHLLLDLAVDALLVAQAYTHLLLIAGSEDLTPLVRAVQGLGRRVTVISILNQGPLTVADQLRRAADQFVDLASLRPHIDFAVNAKQAETVVD